MQVIDMFRQQALPAFKSCNGKKEGTAGGKGADIIWHMPRVALVDAISGVLFAWILIGILSPDSKPIYLAIKEWQETYSEDIEKARRSYSPE